VLKDVADGVLAGRFDGPGAARGAEQGFDGVVHGFVAPVAHDLAMAGVVEAGAGEGGFALRDGYGHVAFDVTDLDDAYDRAMARGARPVMAPCPSPEPGVRMAFVADPEGNLVELLHRGAA